MTISCCYIAAVMTAVTPCGRTLVVINIRQRQDLAGFLISIHDMAEPEWPLGKLPPLPKKLVSPCPEDLTNTQP